MTGHPTQITVAETDRLVLRRFTPEDAGFVLRLLNEPSFIQNIGDKGVRTLDQAARYLADGPIQSYARNGHGLNLVSLKDSLQPIGMCGLLKRDGLLDVDLGYAFLPEFCSRGYAYEAAAGILRSRKGLPRLKRIVAFVSPGNAASIRVLHKLGFSLAGMTRLDPAAPEVSLYSLPVADDSPRAGRGERDRLP
jgi:RimJ/RimL family protein N-acetyltransferase